MLGSVTFCVAGSPFREIARDDEGEFRMLAVNPAVRGRGVGQALVELCLQRSRELGYAGVRMSSMDRMTSAHRVYERLGFVRAPEDDWSPAPGRDPARLRPAVRRPGQLTVAADEVASAYPGTLSTLTV